MPLCTRAYLPAQTLLTRLGFKLGSSLAESCVSIKNWGNLGSSLPKCCGEQGRHQKSIYEVLLYSQIFKFFLDISLWPPEAMEDYASNNCIGVMNIKFCPPSLYWKLSSQLEVKSPVFTVTMIYNKGSCPDGYQQMLLYTKMNEKTNTSVRNREIFHACKLADKRDNKCDFQCEMQHNSLYYEVYVMFNIWYRYNPNGQICDIILRP